MSRMKKYLLILVAFLFASSLVKAEEMITVEYTKVTDFSTLTDGDEIIIVNESTNKALGPNPKSTKNRLARDVEISGNKVVSMSSEVAKITLEDAEVGFYFKVNEGYLAVKYNHLNDSKFYLTSETTNEPSSIYTSTTAFVKADNDGNPLIVFTLHKDKKTTVSKNVAYDGSNVFSTTDYSPSNFSNIRIYRRTDIPEIAYNQDADMSGVISSQDATVDVNVTLNRSFVADDGWYTICLPFAVTTNQMKRLFGSDVNIQEFDSAVSSGDILLINFVSITGDLAAGKPYLIKPTKDVNNPVFKRVRISVTEPMQIVKNDYKFIGVFSPWQPEPNDKTIRFLSGSNGKQLDYPNSTTGVLRGTRAYFKFPASAASSSANAITEDELGIISPYFDNVNKQHTYIYTIDGKIVDSNTTILKDGIYVVNGKLMLKRQK